MSKLSKAGLAVALTLVLGATLLAPANAPAYANGTPVIDVVGEELSFEDSTDVGSDAGQGESFRYKDVATIGTARIDAEVTVNRVEGLVTEVGGEDDCDNEKFAVDFFDLESSSRSKALLTELQVCPSSTGYIEYSVAFFVTTTDDVNFATDEVILKNLSVTFTDADRDEFMMVYGAKGYRLTEETTVTAQTIGSNVQFQAASDSLRQ